MKRGDVMRLQQAVIKNFKGISECNLEFRPGFNLLKGENGKGKTSVLEALAVGLGGFVAGAPDVPTRHFSLTEIRRVYVTTGDGSCTMQAILPTEVTLIVKMKDRAQPVIWTRGRSSVQASRSTIRPREIAGIAEIISNQPEAELPLLCYESAGRVWSQKRERSINVFRSKYLRTVGYLDALADESNIKLLLNWCMRMEQIGWQKGVKISEYEAAKKAVADFMTRINNGGDYGVFYDKQIEELMLVENGEVRPVIQLSAGYQSLIWMVFDIAYRMALLNPFLLENIAQTAGIVLIDELDTHLHPRWQWRVIGALKETFPNIQFIAATHSPSLFASSRDVWIVDIEQGDPQYSISQFGLDLNSATKMYQGDYNLPIEVQTLANKFYYAMNQQDYTTAGNYLNQLSAITDSDTPLLVEMRTIFQLETNWPEESE